MEVECASDLVALEERIFESPAQREKFGEEVQHEWDLHRRLRARINEIRSALPLLTQMRAIPLRTRHWKVEFSLCSLVIIINIWIQSFPDLRQFLTEISISFHV